MNQLISTTISVLTLVAGTGWIKIYFDKRNSLKKENERLVCQYLAPIQTNLDLNSATKKRIYDQYREEKWGILESYVIKVKRNPKSTEVPLMRQDITAIALTNQKIIDLLTGYAGYVKTEELKQESKNYIQHAQTWINRWSAVPEVINNKDQLPYAEPFPAKFAAALVNEIAFYYNNGIAKTIKR